MKTLESLLDINPITDEEVVHDLINKELEAVGTRHGRPCAMWKDGVLLLKNPYNDLTDIIKKSEVILPYTKYAELTGTWSSTEMELVGGVNFPKELRGAQYSSVVTLQVLTALRDLSIKNMRFVSTSGMIKLEARNVKLKDVVVNAQKLYIAANFGKVDLSEISGIVDSIYITFTDPNPKPFYDCIFDNFLVNVGNVPAKNKIDPVKVLGLQHIKFHNVTLQLANEREGVVSVLIADKAQRIPETVDITKHVTKDGKWYIYVKTR